MKLVQQHGRHDCGVCALATVLGRSWSVARNAIWPAAMRKRTYGTHARQLVKAARKLGAKAPRQRLTIARSRKWDDVPAPSLVKVVFPDQRGTRGWHWVVWDGHRVLDPQNAEIFRPHNAPWRPESYIEVRRR